MRHEATDSWILEWSEQQPCRTNGSKKDNERRRRKEDREIMRHGERRVEVRGALRRKDVSGNDRETQPKLQMVP